MGWEVAPANFTDLLMRLDRDYDLPPLFITENGAAYPDLLVDGGVKDEVPARLYRESHTRHRGCHRSGCRCARLLRLVAADNFEWAAGYTKRFGIYYGRLPDQARILKRSGFWYKDLAAAFHRTHRGTVAT